MHGQRDVTEHRLWARCRDSDVPEKCVGSVLELIDREPRRSFGKIGDCIANVVEISRLLTVLRFLITQRRHAARAPVDHAVSAIDQAAFV